MGHSSKFYFPIPGRKQKAPAPIIAPVPPPNGAPLTKAQRILGTGPINIDSAGASSNTKRAWDGQSNVAISVSVTDTSATEWDNAGSRLGSGHHDDRRVGSGHRDRRWEEESEVLPKDGLTVTMGHDDTTDASSLRRRQSSSTIRSYYDKAKVPLSISQQTANSAMAKGLPSNSKAHALLDIEGNFDTQRLKNKKKPSRLDLSSLIPRHKSSKTHLRPEPERTHVLGPDLLTKSPSIMSISPTPTPPPIVQRIERKLRSKMTKESLRSISSVPDTIPPLSVTHSDTTKQPSIKANPQLHNLYDHYEQRTFEDALERDLHASQGRAPPPDRPLPAYPTPPTSNTGNPSLSPFPRSTSRAGHQNPPPLTVTVPELQLSRPPSEPSLASPVADYASISSRHTRTSKASRRTDRSLTEIDLLQNSVLALSSDSEDDYEASNDQLSVPPPSDGPASPVSPRSALSQQYSKSDDGSRNKPLKQTTFAENPEFFPAKQEPKSAVPPKILARSSSLTVTSSNHSQIYPPNIRISNGTTSTVQTLGYSALLTPTTHEANAINMVPQSKFRDQTHAFRPVSEETQFEDFPAPPIHSAPRPGPTSHPAERTSLLSPTRVDFYLQSQHISVARDNASIRSDASHGSGGNARRGSATSSLNDSGSGRFMAVTRQEEALLAALRQKRARMREHILAEYEETDRSGSAVSNSRPRKASANANSPLSEKAEHGRILFMMDEADSDVTGLVQLDEFPAPAEFDRRRSRSAAAQRPLMSTPSQRQRPQRSSSLPGRSSDHSSPKTAPANNRPNRIVEDPCEDDENQGVPRPDSPISPADFPAPVSSMNNKIVNKKQVRLSAVGSYKPNVEAGWWDDSG